MFGWIDGKGALTKFESPQGDLGTPPWIAPRAAQERPETAKDRPKTTQDRPRSPQDRPTSKLSSKKVSKKESKRIRNLETHGC